MKKRLLILLLPALLLFTGYAYAAWSNATRVTNNSVPDYAGQLIIENGRQHVIYGKSNSVYSDNFRILYKTRKSSSSTWSSPVNISSSNFPAGVENFGSASVAAYNGKAHIVYDYFDGNDLEIGYKTNKQGSWPSAPIKLTNNARDDIHAYLVNDNEKLYLVYSSFDGKDYEIYLRKNITGTWEAPVKLTNNDIDDISPHLYVKKGQLHLVWTREESSMLPPEGISAIKYKVFKNGSWSAAKTVISSTSRSYLSPKIVVHNSIPYFTYTIFIKVSQDLEYTSNIGFSYFIDGKWVRKNVTSSSMPYIYNRSPELSVYQGVIRLLWTEDNDIENDSDIYYGVFTRSSGSWSKAKLTNTLRFRESGASIVVDPNGKNHIIYSSDQDGDYEVYYKKTY